MINDLDYVENKKKIITLRILILSILFFTAEAKVLIFTYCFNRPDLTELQFKTLKKFIVDQFDYIVFNDASTSEMSLKIITTCQKLGVRCIRIPQEIHSKPYLERPNEGLYKPFNIANVRNSNVVQWSLDNFGFFHKDILVLLDGDIFLTKKLDIRSFLKNYDIAAKMRPCYEFPIHKCEIAHPNVPTVKYMWIGLVFLDMANLPNKKTLNFNCGIVEGNIQVDAGGYTYYYLKNNPNVKLKSLNRLRTRDLNINQLANEMNRQNFADACKELAFKIKSIDPRTRGIEFYAGEYFVHYFGASNYYHASQGLHDVKTEIFQRFVLQIIN